MQAFANRDKLKPDMKNSIILSIHNDAFLSGFTRGSLEKLITIFTRFSRSADVLL